MKMTKEQFELLHLRPAIYDGAIMTLNVSFDDKSFWRTEAKTAVAMGMRPGDTAEIFGKVIDFGNEEYKYCHEKFCISGDLLTEFIELFGFENIKACVHIKVKFRYLYVETDCNFNDDDEQIVFEVLEINPQNQNSSDISDVTPSWLSDYFMDGMK